MTPTTANRFARAAELLFLLALVFGIQWHLGVYAAENLGNPDEPAHLVTGLMVRQYVLAAEGTLPNLGPPPMAFAEDYYLHYPKIAIGHWPPVFYAMQAGWTQLFPATRESVMVMIATLMALLAFSISRLVGREYGPVPGMAAAVSALVVPGIVVQYGDVMTEVLQAVIITAALYAYSRFLKSGGWGASLAFGLLASAALLTKGTGLVLAAVPLLAVAFSRQFALVKRAVFWFPGVLVLLLAAPWYIWAPAARHERAIPLGGPGLIESRIVFPPFNWTSEFGWIIAILAAIAMWTLLYQVVRGKKLEPMIAVCTAAVISGTVFPMLFVVWNARHQVEILFPIMMLAAAGAHLLVRWTSGVFAGKSVGDRAGLHPAWAAVPFVLAALIGALNISRREARTPTGYPELVKSIEASTDEASMILISGSSGAEGAFVAAVAQQELTPQRYLVRATQLLADLNWLGRDDGQVFDDPKDIEEALDKLPIDMVVIDVTHPAPFPYAPVLEQMLSTDAEWSRWKGTSDDRFRVYVREALNADLGEMNDTEIQHRLRQIIGNSVL